MFEFVRYERRGDVAFLTLDRPAQLNAVHAGLVRDLVAALRFVGEDGVGAAVLSGAGRAFCAGHDFHQPPEDVDPGALARIERLADVTRAVRSLPAPVVAAVHGYALGAGCEIALACDLVVAGTDAVLGFPEVSVGLGITGGISRLLPAAVGPAKAKELVLLGARFGAEEAARLGLVNAVADDPLAQATAWAEELASRPRLAVAFAKAALDRGPEGDLETSHALETAASLALMNTPQARSAAAGFRARHPAP